MIESHIYLVRVYDERGQYTDKEAWTSLSRAQSSQSFLAHEDAETTAGAMYATRVLPGPPRSKGLPPRLLIQKLKDERSGERWVTLRHWEVSRMVLRGGVIDRLADVLNKSEA